MNRGRGRRGRGGRATPMAWISRQAARSGNPPQSGSAELPVEGGDLSRGNIYRNQYGNKNSAPTFVDDRLSEHSGIRSCVHDTIHQGSSCQRKDGFSNLDRHQQRQQSPHESGCCQEVKCSVVSSQIKEKRISSYSAGSVSKEVDGDSVQNQTGTAACMDVLNSVPNSSLQYELLPISLQEKAEGQLPIKLSGTDKSSTNVPDNDEQPIPTQHFDICPSKDTKTVVLKTPLLVRNRQKRNEVKQSMEGHNGIILQSGMLLLKGYLSLSNQVKIVNKCRDLGKGAGGFYQPGYRDGGKLSLKMMCLGKNWDPQTSEYGDLRPIDGAKPPAIPAEFFQLVEKAVRHSHALIEQDSKTKNPEKTLPWISPDICIVNFYSENGRLGLHQDRDESTGSLDKGLPVVSFSVGDSADFLYGDQRDVEKANKVVLESGDILIFGGRSRHVFHGVAAIHPNTAPKDLLEQTSLRPGRLNLTFRQY